MTTSTMPSVSNNVPRFSPDLHRLVSNQANVKTAIVGTLMFLPAIQAKTKRDTSLDYVVDCIVEAVRFTKGCPPSSVRPSQLRDCSMFKTYVASVLHKVSAKLDTIFLALVYVDLFKFEGLFKDEELACEKMFLGSLILAKRVSTHFLLRPETSS